jgi:hypothetical protein
MARFREVEPGCECPASHREGERGDDQNRCNGERDMHSGGNGLGPRGVMSLVAEANANTAPITDAPETWAPARIVSPADAST